MQKKMFQKTYCAFFLLLCLSGAITPTVVALEAFSRVLSFLSSFLSFFLFNFSLPLPLSLSLLFSRSLSFSFYSLSLPLFLLFLSLFPLKTPEAKLPFYRTWLQLLLLTVNSSFVSFPLLDWLPIFSAFLGLNIFCFTWVQKERELERRERKREWDKEG